MNKIHCFHDVFKNYFKSQKLRKLQYRLSLKFYLKIYYFHLQLLSQRDMEGIWQNLSLLEISINITQIFLYSVDSLPARKFQYKIKFFLYFWYFPYDFFYISISLQSSKQCIFCHKVCIQISNQIVQYKIVYRNSMHY